MASVLDRLTRKQNTESSSPDVADRMYQTLMSDIKLRAQEEARKEVMAELEGARAEAVRISAERDAAILLHQTAESTVNTLNDKVSQLEGDVAKGAKSVAMGQQQLTDSTQVIKSELSQERIKVQQLELTVANLEGRLLEKPKDIKPQMIQPSPITIPDFKITPVRGADGRIVDATVSAVTH